MTINTTTSLHKSEHLTHPKYRADIDGLRAIAVLSVVGFHAFPGWVKGGFIGVDIFFVISGFLISTIIFDNLLHNTFSFVEFYSRRIKRIFPALLLVLIANYAFGWFSLLADEYKQLGKHIAAGAGFVSNFAFWNESGYFDNAAETKPLLHLWSLGIEEQFYIIWPLLLWAAWKQRLNWLPITITIAAICFLLNIRGVHTDAVATFYSPQTRFWELLIGSLLAYIRLYKQGLFAKFKLEYWLSSVVNTRALNVKGTTLNNVQSFLGAALIATAILIITKERHFPGMWALLPTLGAALIISAGAQAWINRAILSNRVLVWFGLISFPLYLWHWPLLSFARIVKGELPSPEIRIAAVLISILLAWLTYKLIEKPIRFGNYNKAKNIILILLMIVMGCSGYNTYKHDGLKFRPIAKQANILSNYNYFNGKSEADFWGSNSCFNLFESYLTFEKNGCEKIIFQGHKKIFLMGDSHSAYLSQGLRDYLINKEYNLFQYSAGYCTPLSLNDKRERCQQINKHSFEIIKREIPDTIIIFANYLAYESNGDNGEKIPYENFILEKIKEYKNIGVKKVVLIGQIPTWEDSLPKTLIRRFVLKLKAIPERTYDGVTPKSLEWDKKLKEQNYPDNVIYVSLKDFLCNTSGCLTKTGPDLQNDLIVFDYGHLTKSGANYITQSLLSKSIR